MGRPETLPRLAPLHRRITGPASDAWATSDRAFSQMRGGREIIHLGVGDPDIATSPDICSALTRALEAGRTHYSPLAGEPALREAIAAHGRRLYGAGVAGDNVAVCAGAQGALYAVFQLLAGAGDEVIVLSPHYATYPAVVTAGGARLVTVDLESATGFQPDLERIARAITPRTVAVLVNSPGNPSGAVFAQETMDALVDLAAAHDIWLVSDEVYWSLTYGVAHPSPLRRQDLPDNVIVVNSLSKSHAMTGWRLGWVIAPPSFIDAMTALAQPFHFGINQFVQDAAVSAVADDAGPAAIRDSFRVRRDALVLGLRRTDSVCFSEPQGGMFLFLDVSASGQDGLAFAEGLLDAEGVAVVAGSAFGPSASHMVRIGFLCEPDQLFEAAERVVRHAEGLRR